MDNYSRMEEPPKVPDKKFLIIGYVSLGILFALIITYTILSPSLFSSLSLAFMLIGFAASISTPYYVERTVKEDEQNKGDVKVIAYPIERIIWGLFLALNLGIFGFKLYVCITGTEYRYTKQMQQFLQIQSYLYMFLPLLLIPFIVGCLLIRTKTRKLSEFRKRINKGITIPVFLVMGILIVLIEIFTISLAGLLFFFCILALYIQRKLDFNNIFSRILVGTVQFLSFVFIFANFLLTTSYLQSLQKPVTYRLYGLNALNDFLALDVSRGYIICLILVFIVTCITHRIFVYSRVWEYTTKFKQLQEITGEEILREQGFRDFGSIDSPNFDINSNRSLGGSIMNQPFPQNKKVRGLSLQQYQMQSVSDRSGSQMPQQRRIRTEYGGDAGQYRPPIMTEEEKIEKSSIGWRERKKEEKGSGQGKKIMDQFLWGINVFVDFIYSTEFALRVTEIISIIVIQRFNNVYSFVALIWLALVASVQNIRIIFYITLIVLLPVQIGNFIIMFTYNAPGSPLANMENMQIYGFQPMSLFWLDILIFNVYFFYMITFLLSASRDSRITFHSSKQKSKPSIRVLILAFFFRHSHLLTILAIFFLGFSEVTLINLFYVILFLIFFSLGDNVMLQKKLKNGQEIATLNTFARKYWFIIVYYTLICIIAKYIYFLFFTGDMTEQLRPTGINQIYDWSFNFSLSSTCISNTTPFFIVFVLSEMQIMIYRSNIYLYYSYSIVSQFNEISELKKRKSFFNKVIEFINEFYYQALYLITGIIIIFCNYRWSFFGLAIMIATCYAMMRGVNRKVLAVIVFLDLAFLLINYIVLFFNYQVVINFFGESVVDFIQKVSLFFGLILNQGENGLYTVFALNIVIFYFSVESYALATLLNEERFSDQSSVEDEIERDSISLYDETVIDEEMRDIDFAENYNKGVILSTKKYYLANLWEKYRWWYYVCWFFSVMTTDMVAIFVLVSCLYFRLSVSMFYFLIIYMIYYFFLFNQMGKLFINTEFYGRIQREMYSYKAKEEALIDRKNPSSILTGEENPSALFTFIKEMDEETSQLKFQWKQKVWLYASVGSFIFFIATYSTQFIVSQFYKQYINFSWTNTLQSIFFAIGISTNEKISFFRESYFYYVMVIIVVIERLLFKFKRMSIEHQKKQEEVEKKEMKSFRKIDDPAKFIDTHFDFIEETVIHEELEEPKKEVVLKEKMEENENISKQANILIYFKYKETQIKMNIIYGLMMALIRLYLLMMLINLYEKSNIFAFAYLIAVLIFWFQNVRFQLIKDINKAAIIILILQYVMLLLDINNTTSPLPKPNSQDLSLLNNFLSQKWIDYLLIDFDSSGINSFVVSFLISSIIIFLTQFYFTLFFWVSRKVVEFINEVYERYEYIKRKLSRMPEQDTIYLNYENYKNFGYRFTKLSYELFINNSYIIVSMLILILLSNIHTILSTILVFIACIYIYLGIFTDFSQDANINSYTSLYFQIIRLLLFLILIVVSITQIPLFIEKDGNIIEDIQKLQSLSQIFLLFFIQIWLDLSFSSEFKEAVFEYISKVKNRENVLLKCLAYQENIQLASNLIDSYKEILSFEVNIIDAMHIIKEWHKMMSRDMKTSKHEILHESVEPQTVEIMKTQIREELSKRPQDDESIMLKFKNFMNKRTHNPLKFRYYELMRYIVYNNHRVIKHENSNIDIWDYILEDYQKLDEQIKEAEIQLGKIAKAVSEERQGFRMNYLQDIKQLEYSSQEFTLDKAKMGVIEAPKKLFIDIKDQKESLPKMIMYFVLSNFSYFLTFFIWIYYLINPCLLSLPFIIYIFAYEIIADKKWTSLMLLYIFSIIVMAEIVQLQTFIDSTWIKYFFYRTGETSYNFVVGYLFFLFILVFINEEINKYKGTKFRFHSQVESRAQGALRMLINEDNNSKLYLWKMKLEDDEVEEKDCNPMEYYSKKIQKFPQQMMGQQMVGFLDSFKENKVGIDLYPLIASVQIFLTIYLIFFYTFMVQTTYAPGLQDTIKYFQFSSDMVIAVLVHVLSIVLQRRITLMTGQGYIKQRVKYYYTMIILGLFCLFIYYIAPRNSAIQNVYEPTAGCIAFSFFYFIYFFLSALQIRFGYKKYKSLNSIMTRRRMLNNILLVGFTSIPFLLQLKTFMDFSFCKTSLKIFDWFRLFGIYYAAFKAKLQYYGATGVTLNQPLNWLFKSIGWLGFIGILFIIFLPMVLFSGLNPIAQTNLVTSGSLELGIQIQKGNYFQLYSTGHFSKPPKPFTSQEFYKLGFNQVPYLSTLTSSDIPKQFEEVNYQAFGDTTWGISEPNFESLVSSIQETIEQMNKTDPKPPFRFNIVVKYQLTREVTETIPVDTDFYYPSQGTYLNLTHLQSLNKTLTTCDEPSFFSDFYISLIRLNTVGNTYKPKPINYINDENRAIYEEGVKLTLICTGSNSTSDTNNVFWALNVTENDTEKSTNEGVILFVYCDKYQNLIGGLGFTALYTSVILVVGNLIRSAFDGNLPLVPYYQNPKPDNILQICQAIGTLRVRKQYREEYLMYYQLIDIMRSPQIMKYMSGSYPVLIEEVNDARKKKLLEKERELERKKIE